MENRNQEILTRCGFRCDMCPAYVENIGNLADPEAVRLGWKKYFGFDIPADQVVCDGCLNEGKHADKDCPVRPCAIVKKVATCAQCADYGCEKLKSRMDLAESVIPKFKDIPAQDYNLFFRPYLSRDRLEKLRQDGRNP